MYHNRSCATIYPHLSQLVSIEPADSSAAVLQEGAPEPCLDCSRHEADLTWGPGALCVPFQNTQAFCSVCVLFQNAAALHGIEKKYRKGKAYFKDQIYAVVFGCWE